MPLDDARCSRIHGCSPTDVWCVGSGRVGRRVANWDGSAWTVGPLPLAEPDHFGVWCDSSTGDVWAVGGAEVMRRRRFP